MIDLRYERQARLAEVGETGQARICAASFELAADESAAIELEYLRRAGANAELGARRSPTPFAHAEVFHFAACRAVGEGAWRALDKLRRLLSVGTS